MSRIAAALCCAAGLSSVAVAEEQPLICFGSEPSWSVHLTEPGVARLATPDSEPVTYRGTATRQDVLRETLWRGSPAAGRDLVVWLKDAPCSDGMSETEHPVMVRVSTPDGRFLSGCCRVAVSAAAATNATVLEGATWQLTRLAGKSPELARLSRPVTVRFEAGRVRGFSGCNAFEGGYRLDGDRLKLGHLASTMRACPDPAMSIENAFHAGFSGTLRYAVEGDQLTTTPESGEALQFERAAPPRLDGSHWKVTGYNDDRQAVVSVTGEITLSFGAGEVSGNAGCNAFRASYTTEGPRIRLGPAATTRRACEEALMTQERLFLAALASAVTWSIDGNVLDMHRADSERAIWAVAR